MPAETPDHYVLALVSRILDSNGPDGKPVRISSDAPSWKAHREAETLSDAAFAEAAITLVAGEKKKDRRSALYFIIGKIGGRAHHARCASFLTARLAVETDKYIVYAILQRLAEIPKDASVELSPVYDLFDDERALVKHSAISAVANSTDPTAERRLLEVLQASSDPFALSRANAVLGKVGSARAIPALKRMAFHKKADVASSAMWALTELGSQELLPFFLECLTKGPAPAKWGAMRAIEKFGDESAIEIVFARVKKILAGVRKRAQLPRSELVAGVAFLSRFRGTNAVLASRLDSLVDARAERLFPDEKREIAILRTPSGQVRLLSRTGRIPD